MHLIVTEIIHFTLTSLIAFFIYRRYHSGWLVFVCYLGGFFIDSDHFLDYLFFQGIGNFHLFSFLNSNQYHASGIVYLIFHGYEYVILLLTLAVMVKKWRPFCLALGLAMLGHLLVDQFTNDPAPFTYFISYRLFKNFNLHKLFPLE